MIVEEMEEEGQDDDFPGLDSDRGAWASEADYKP